jgi:hypothetical protein
MAGTKRDITARDVIDLVIALLPVAVLLAIQYRDDIERFRMRIEQAMNPGRQAEAEALRQVQREISLMEHGEYGEASAD